jgi:DNA repair photolyase
MKSEDFLNPSPRKDAIKKLELDAKELSRNNDQREILMSFTTDPYQPLDNQFRLTRKAIQIFMKYNLHYTPLTKGHRPLKDIDLMIERPDLCRFGTTLVFTDKNDCQAFEPKALDTNNRIEALIYAHSHGIRTWVSLEPVIYPQQTLDLIRMTMGFVDEYRIGKLNHITNDISRLEMIEFVRSALQLLENQDHARYIFKKDLEPYLAVI